MWLLGYPGCLLRCCYVVANVFWMITSVLLNVRSEIENELLKSISDGSLQLTGLH